MAAVEHMHDMEEEMRKAQEQIRTRKDEAEKYALSSVRR